MEYIDFVVVVVVLNYSEAHFVASFFFWLPSYLVLVIHSYCYILYKLTPDVVVECEQVLYI